jgi:hypothetical protein
LFKSAKNQNSTHLNKTLNKIQNIAQISQGTKITHYNVFFGVVHESQLIELIPIGDEQSGANEVDLSLKMQI